MPYSPVRDSSEKGLRLVGVSMEDLIYFSPRTTVASIAIMMEQHRISWGHAGFDVVFTLLLIYLLIRIVSERRKNHLPPLPPGPRPLPLLGNIFDLPKGQEGPHWGKHKEQFGPISSIKTFGATIIIINDMAIVTDLLEKRSMNYSDRPWVPFGGEMVGFDRWLTTFKTYGSEFKQHRKHFHTFIGSRSAVARFQELMEVETRRFLLQVLQDSDGFYDYIRDLPGTLILKMSYGYTTDKTGSDPLVALADEVMSDIFSNACVFGNWTVDTIPFVRHLPEWIPGMGFKRKARRWARAVAEFPDKPYAFVQHQMATGKFTHSFISESIGKGVTGDDSVEIMKCVAASMYAGGSDTTVTAISIFYLAMTLYPKVLVRAQEEIDRVVGPDRLPSFSDRENLPYIEALVQETFRWENVVSFNQPHRVMEDDTYMGYGIPKGAVVLANIWQMTHDPENYIDPEKYDPERFLGENGRHIEPDPRTIAFGFGRRVCPGKELAINSLYIAIAMTVAVFNITKAKDESGADIEPLHEYVSGAISHLKPFRCSIKPRTEKAARLIRLVTDDYPLEKGDGDLLQTL